jgi:hypothetical protein
MSFGIFRSSRRNIPGDFTVGDDVSLSSDSSVLKFGADGEITITHVDSAGLLIKNTDTGDGSPIVLRLQTGETAIETDDIVSSIYFQAPDETGTDAIKICAAIEVTAEADFDADENKAQILFKTAVSEAAETKMVIKSTGNVGIGVTAPSAKLYVYSNTGTTSYAAAFQNDGNNAARYGLKVSAGADDASGTTYYMLCADGDGHTIGYIANTDDTFALATVSDIRIKDNVRDTSISGLEIVEEIQVRDFEMKKNGISKTGFIAQELKDIYPAAVTGEEDDFDENGDMMPMGVSFANLVPALVKSIQELSQNNKDLTARIIELEQKLAD